MKPLHTFQLEDLTRSARVQVKAVSPWTSPLVLRRLFVSESLKRTYKLGNCTRMGLGGRGRASRFRSVPFCLNTRASWLLGKNCARRSGRKTHLSTLTTRSIQRSPRSDSHWETTPTIPGLWKLSHAAAIVSSAQLSGRAMTGARVSCQTGRLFRHNQ